VSAPASPGFADQSRKRTVLRAVGITLTVVGLVLLGIALVDFFSGFGDTSDMSDDGPGLFWLFFVALPVLFVGLACTQLGFLGAASRYTAGESAPVLKDTASYLTDGEGFLGVGRTVDDRSVPAAAGGAFCSQCGAAHDRDARFCKSCGAPVA
jgi:hypothetical protein